jgi:signal transduction histidine kinase/ActR/RegA family two-component response regulator
MKWNMRTSSISLLVILFLANIASAAWSDSIQGSPIVDRFSAREIGVANVSACMIQDARGRLFAGGDKLLVFDGVSWKNYPMRDSYAINAMCFDQEGRLWAGGYNQLGYYTETAAGEFIFTSLRDRLPPDQRIFFGTWGCGVVEGKVYFICKSKIFRWDGDSFTTWDFPTDVRLFPVSTGNELWFTHLESGLYRLTADGPQLEYRPAQLAHHAAFWIEHDSQGLFLISRDGVYRAGHPDQVLCAKETLDFLRPNALSSVARLPDGNFALGTLDGLGIMAPDGRLLRILRHEDGLPANPVNSLYLDRENHLWITSISSTGICRIAASGASSLFHEWRPGDHASIAQLSINGDALYAATDIGVHQLQPTPHATSRFAPLPALPSDCFSLLPWGSGLLLGDFGTLQYFDARRCSLICAVPGTKFMAMAASHQTDGVIYCIENHDLARLRQNADGEWENEVLQALPDWTKNLFLDPQDNVWLGSFRQGVSRFVQSTGRIHVVHNGQSAGLPAEFSCVTGYQDHVYFFTARQAFVANALTARFHRIVEFPEVHCHACSLSHDGRRAYVAFERARNANAITYGLGVLQLDEKGEPLGWHEFQVPGLETAGVPSTLLTTAENGEDAVWIGGSESILHIKPSELALIQTPARPWLQAHESSGRPGSAEQLPIYDFAHHHLFIEVGAHEIDQRSDLWFQTRLGPGNTEWSAASPRSAFEFNDLVNGSYCFSARAVNSAGQISEPATFKFRIRPPWYRSTWAYSSYACMLAAGFYCVARTRERIIRARNRELEDLVAVRTDKLIKANATKDEFLANVSHEIRNPLNGVVGLAAAIDSSGFDPKTQQRFTQLRHCTAHLSGLLEDLLDYSGLDADAVKLNPQPFNLQELVESVAALSAAESALTGIPVEIAVSPTVPDLLIGDVARIRQILLNYVVNGLKYSGRGIVRLTVWCRSGETEFPVIIFAVSDDGPGIPPEEQARLFTRFERGSAARALKVAGTGLGLSLCKKLGEEMGGRLWLESKSNAGNTFYFEVCLPVAAASQTGQNDANLPLAFARFQRALVVDDEEYNRLALSALLEEIGFHVVAASDGDKAITAARTENFDIVFLDIRMPARDGLETTRALRAMAHLDPHVPIVVTTAYISESIRAQCVAAGVAGFITKPVTLEKIRSSFFAGTQDAPSVQPGRLADDPQPSYPLATIRLMAARKGVSWSTELASFLDDLAKETLVLTAAVQQHDHVNAPFAAHRLIARLVYLRATEAADVVTKIESNAMNGLWPEAESAVTRLEALITKLREQTASLAKNTP